tara:strand:- start:711 stop:1787 length:1077 start_codon:yes stop_codon:yes gene_type:complete
VKFKLNHPYKTILTSIAKRIKEQGYELYLVGGTIRDALMGRISTDIDLATNATPNSIESLFKETVATGKKYGTITIKKTYQSIKIPIQITTFRSDGDYSDSRHPDSVTFETSLKEDVKRRDFTINALAYDLLTEEIVDYVEGKNDLKNKILRVIGNPQARFQEDSLRLVRCCRFMAQFEFSCEIKTWETVCMLGKTITLPSKERITQELLKLLASKKPSIGINALIESGLGERLFPGISNSHKTVINDLDKLERNIRLAYLLKDLEIDRCFRQLRLSKKQEKWIKSMIQHNFDHKKVVFTKKDLALSGADIKSMGFQDKQIGIIQQHCLDYVMQDFSHNTKVKLKHYIQTISNEGNIH